MEKKVLRRWRRCGFKIIFNERRITTRYGQLDDELVTKNEPVTNLTANGDSLAEKVDNFDWEKTKLENALKASER